MSSTANASTIWDGGIADPPSPPTWGTAANWSDDVVPALNNSADLSFPTSSVVNFNTVLGSSRTVRSLTFGADVDGPFSVNFQTSAGGATGANLTFDTNAVGGNATVTVQSGATGAITLGTVSALGGTTLNPLLADNLVVDHNGSGLLLFNRPFQTAAFGITKNGTGRMQTNNNNFLTGELNINAGTLIANSFSATGLDLANFSAIKLGGGTLQIATSSGIAKTYATGPITVTSASTLEYRNATATNYTLGLSGTGFVLDADLALKNVSTDTTLVNGINLSRAITGSGEMAITTYNNIDSNTDSFGLGRVLLTADNSAWSGDLTVARGTISLGGTAVNSAGTGVITIGTASDAFGAGVTFFPQGSDGSTVSYANPIVVHAGGFRAIKGGGTNHSVTFNGDITLNGDLTVDHTWASADRRITLNGDISGDGGLTITKAGGNGATTARLTGINTYVGDTNVATGASLMISGSLTSNVSVAANARFGGNGGSTSQNFTMGAGAKLIFNYVSSSNFKVTGAVTLDNGFGVASLVGSSQGEAINWALVPVGTYTPIGTTASTFNNISNFGLANAADLGDGKIAYFQNGGGLQLVVANSAAGYDAWKLANGTAQTGDLDHDNDGVSNGVEFFLGGAANTTGFTALPAVADTAGTLSITWTKAADYTGTYPANFLVETSETLATGSWSTETLGGSVVITGNDVKYTFPAGTKKFARLKVTGP